MSKRLLYSIVAVGLFWILGLLWQAETRHTPEEMCQAAISGNTMKVRALLRANPKLARATDREGMTALHWAVRFGRVPVARELIKAGADVNAVNNRNMTPLHLTAYAGFTDESIAMAKMLLAHKADISIRSRRGHTVLHLTAFLNRPLLARILLEHGADPNVRNTSGITPLASARRSGHTEMVELLLEYKAEE